MAGTQSDEPLLMTACEYLKDSEEGYQVLLDRRKASQAQTQKEKTSHTLFHVRMHIDAMYTATSTGTSTYGLVGMHFTFAELGRIQFFIPPGVMLYEVPKERGGHRLVPATTAGVSIRLFETDFFGRPVNLHLNFAKAWVSGAVMPSTDVVGLSFTFKK